MHVISMEFYEHHHFYMLIFGTRMIYLQRFLLFNTLPNVDRKLH